MSRPLWVAAIVFFSISLCEANNTTTVVITTANSSVTTDNVTTTASSNATTTTAVGTTTTTLSGTTTVAQTITTVAATAAATTTTANVPVTTVAATTTQSANAGNAGSNNQAGPTCQTPLGIANGQIVTPGPYYNGSIVTFNCLYGFGMAGSPSQVCDAATQTWSGSPPSCSFITNSYDWFLIYVIGGGVGGLLFLIVFFLMIATCYWMCCRKPQDGSSDGSRCCGCCEKGARSRKQRVVSVTPSPRGNYNRKWDDSPRRSKVTQVSEVPPYESPPPPKFTPKTKKTKISGTSTKVTATGKGKISWMAKAKAAKGKSTY